MKEPLTLLSLEVILCPNSDSQKVYFSGLLT